METNMTHAFRILLLVFALIINSSFVYAQHTSPFKTIGWEAVDDRVDYNWRLNLIERATDREFSLALIEFGDEVTLTITTSCELEPLPDEEEEDTTEEVEQEVKTIISKSSEVEVRFSGCSHIWIIPDHDRPLLKTIKEGILAGDPNVSVLNLLGRLPWWSSID